jgi:predicted phage-related endonuclease
MRQGRDLEEYVAQRFTEATGLKVRRSNQMYRSKENPFMLADVDRLVIGEDAGLECKTASAYNTDKWKDGEIPAHYLIQCFHYMAVTGKRNWYIAVVLLGVGFQYAKISWDDEMIKNLISLEKTFWKKNVLKRVMPTPDGSAACDAVLEQYFHTARKNSAIVLSGFEGKLERRLELDELIKKLELEKKQIEQEVKLAMADNELAVAGRFKVSWTNVDTNRLDTKRMKEEMPEIYKNFNVSGSSRRFQIKAA